MTESRKLRTVLLGMGAGAEHLMLPGLTTLPGIDLVAGCDPSAAAREGAGARWHISRLYDDPAKMLAEEKPDLVAISTPPQTHYDLAKLALSGGAHLFCEKPFVQSLAQADELIALARAQGRHIVVNNQYYQMPIFRRVQESLDQFGRLYQITAWQHMHLLPDTEGGWKAALQPRRVLFEFGTHPIDLICRYFDAYPEAVTARVARVRADVNADVCITVRLDFPGERMATLYFNRMSFAPIRYFEMRLDAEKASVRTSMGGVAQVELGWNTERRRPRFRFSLTGGGETRVEQRGGSRQIAVQRRSAAGDATTAHMAQAVQALQAGREPQPGIDHARAVLQAMLAAYESAESGGELIRLQAPVQQMENA